jgi:glycosyltransferase involved in cell wall biosynthesis
MPTVTVVIPAFNETDRIVDTIKAVKEIDGIAEIIVINDGSTDDTSEKARGEGVTVIDLNPNRGKGGAMNASLPYIKTDVVAFLDGDLGAAAGEAGKIIRPVVEGVADLCIASFPPPRKKGGFGIVKGTAAWAIRKVGKIEVTAPLSGQRAMTLKVLKTVTPFHEGYGVELGMSINALLHGFKLMEVPTTMTHKETGRDLSGFIHRGQQFIDVVRVIRRETRGKII